MKLIIDAGSTKTTWCVVDEAGTPVLTVRSHGINAATMPTEVILDAVNEVYGTLSQYDCDIIRYYGAGVVNDETAMRIRDILATNLGGETCIEVFSDMVGAARALFGKRAGIACILGTGSNSCLYDGEMVVANVPPLGFILGDEGSGASIGRRFLGDLFKGLLPDRVMAAWQGDVGMSMPEVIERVYRQPSPNAFLASLAPFVHSQLGVDEVRLLVEEEFERFFARNVERYDTPRRLVGFVGGVATEFATELTNVATRRGYTVSGIITDPLPDLLK